MQTRLVRLGALDGDPEIRPEYEPTVRRNYLYPRDDQRLGSDKLELVDGDHDLLGDGSINLLSTPGHTPGHQSVMFNEQLVIGRDVAHFSATLDDKRFPAWADDFTAQGESAERLRRLRDSGIDVVSSTIRMYSCRGR